MEIRRYIGHKEVITLAEAFLHLDLLGVVAFTRAQNANFEQRTILRVGNQKLRKLDSWSVVEVARQCSRVVLEVIEGIRNALTEEGCPVLLPNQRVHGIQFLAVLLITEVTEDGCRYNYLVWKLMLKSKVQTVVIRLP